MPVRDTIIYSKRKNTNIYNAVDRENFVCMELHIPTESNFIRRAYVHAEQIMPNLNIGQANSSQNREWNVVEIDNLSGVIAELACKEVLDWRYGKGKFLKPDSNTSRNQIDLKLYNGKTIEVRSSCVRNGIDFALFARNKEKPGEQYFDVIGPYSNGYKPTEIYKDYYMRVLYECDKKKFPELLRQPTLKMFITGGATKEMMLNQDYYQIKHLTPAGGQVQEESDYRVIPLARSLDVQELFAVLEKENAELKVMRTIS